MTVLWVALGGAIGASLRYAVVKAALRFAGPGFPWGTLAVNVAGSFLMGIAAAMLLERAGGAKWAPFVLTGIFGGFTTYSAYALDTLYLIETGELAKGAAYAIGTMIFAIAALFLGLAIGRSIG